MLYTHAEPDDAEVVNKNNFSSAQNLQFGWLGPQDPTAQMKKKGEGGGG